MLRTLDIMDLHHSIKPEFGTKRDDYVYLGSIKNDQNNMVDSIITAAYIYSQQAIRHALHMSGYYNIDKVDVKVEYPMTKETRDADSNEYVSTNMECHQTLMIKHEDEIDPLDDDYDYGMDVKVEEHQLQEEIKLECETFEEHHIQEEIKKERKTDDKSLSIYTGKLRCQNCVYSTLSSGSFKIRQRCKHCDFSFPRKLHLSIHKRDDHKEEIETYLNDLLHKNSRSISTNKLQCQYCVYSTPHSGHFNRHQRRHTGERPYQCTKCDKSFPAKDSLVKHQVTHTGEKPYKCSLCAKCFGRSSHMLRHQRTHTEKGPYQCSYCDKFYDNENNLLRHQKTHTVEKIYQCTQCDYRFSQLSYLVKHQVMHTKDKSYQCSKCDKCFTHKHDLVKHTTTHTGEIPY